MQVLATYHGSIAEFHGHALVEGPSPLREGTFRLTSLAVEGDPVLDRVRPESFTVLGVTFDDAQEAWTWVGDGSWEPLPDL